MSALDTEALVQKYALHAASHRRATEDGDHRSANREHDRLAAVYREIRGRGTVAQEALLPLLTHSDASVRVWAAAHSLEFRPGVAEATLIELAESAGGLARVSAESTLREWRAGRLVFP